MLFFQSKIPPGSVVAPGIMSSDKTQLSTFGGDKSAWPVYLSIANIAKAIRRQPSKHAMVLWGYLSCDKLEHVLDGDENSIAGARLFHDSLAIMTDSLREAGREGVPMTCADGYTRRVHPILFSYICDFPEQALVACVKQSRCPICEVQYLERGHLTDYPYRKHNCTVDAIKATIRGERRG